MQTNRKANERNISFDIITYDRFVIF